MRLSVDYLRVTCSSEAGRSFLRRIGETPEPAKGGATGFQRVERVGPTWFRRSEPYGKSRNFGLDYESWECAGFTPRPDVDWWRAQADAYATRVDLTADFPDLRLRPVQIRDMINARELATGVEKVTLVDGGNDGQTLYLGSMDSPRRLRVYEKGLQLGNQQDLLRVEVTLKEHLARDTFDAYDPADDETAYRQWLGGHWSAHLHKVLNGPLVETWTRDLGEAELRSHSEDLMPWNTVTALANQYGALLAAMHTAGMLVQWVESMAGYSRMAERRADRVVQTVSQDLCRLMDIAMRKGTK